MIRRSMEPDVAHRDSDSQRHTEGLDRAIKILVMDGVFIMPNPSGGIRHFVDNERTTIDPRLRLDRSTGRSSPGIGGRSHSHRGANGRKGETRRPSDIVTTIGRIVIHVALPGVRLAPGVLMWRYVLRFGEVGRARIHRRVQIAPFHQNPVRCACVSVARVVG